MPIFVNYLHGSNKIGEASLHTTESSFLKESNIRQSNLFSLKDVLVRVWNRQIKECFVGPTSYEKCLRGKLRRMNARFEEIGDGEGIGYFRMFASC